MQYRTRELSGVTVVEFELDNGVISPEELAESVGQAPEVDATKGVILSGRGPIWLAAALTHHYHATAWVGCFDPRLNGAVVVERHSATAPQVGEVVEVPAAQPA